MSTNNSLEEGEAKSFIYPLTLQNEKYYFIYSDVLKAAISYEVMVKNNFLVLILSCIVFILSFLIITNNKIEVFR